MRMMITGAGGKFQLLAGGGQQAFGGRYSAWRFVRVRFG